MLRSLPSQLIFVSTIVFNLFFDRLPLPSRRFHDFLVSRCS